MGLFDWFKSSDDNETKDSLDKLRRDELQKSYNASRKNQPYRSPAPNSQHTSGSFYQQSYKATNIDINELRQMVRELKRDLGVSDDRLPDDIFEGKDSEPDLDIQIADAKIAMKNFERDYEALMEEYEECPDDTIKRAIKVELAHVAQLHEDAEVEYDRLMDKKEDLEEDS